MATVTVDAEALAAEVLAEGQRHAPQTPGRRAAGHLWACLITSANVSAARSAIATFSDKQTQSDAAALLGRLVKEHECQP